jgi:hypothetical protein
MPLNIETFSNIHGGNAFFKAVSHPLVGAKMADLLNDLKGHTIAIYDPLQQMEAFAQFHDLSSLHITGYYVQDIAHLDKSYAGKKAQPVTELKNSSAPAVLIAAFDTSKLADQVRHLLPKGIRVFSFDALRLPDAMMSDKARYLSPINFATNFAFFRDAQGHHTRIATANYWAGYGAGDAGFWCCLFGEDGKVLAQWQEKLPATPGASIIIDSKEVRARFKLPEFTGQLFIHATGIKGHDIVKYALDTYGDKDDTLSCTHDANSWPSDFYAGLPAPANDEEVHFWVQNSQPFPIPKGEIVLNLMGRNENAALKVEVAPFASLRLNVADLLPDARWPQQLEVNAGKYIVRPRYEVKRANGRVRMAHVNVERSDLKTDPQLAKLGPLMGKGFILPAPILPLETYASFVLPTPMARDTQHFPLKALIYDAEGQKIMETRLGNLPRHHASLVDVKALLKKDNKNLTSGYGHIELVYDFDAGQEADGWLHGLFRYVDEKTGHGADSSFGSHIFNTALVYKNEPQSYAGRPPGLTTKLFLRLGQAPYDTFCHLIYPASTPWHAQSDTALILTSAAGKDVATKNIKIPCSGSHRFVVREVFDEAALKTAGEGAYVTIRDVTCRLFGYHGLLNGTASFSLDHMFGF